MIALRWVLLLAAAALVLGAISGKATDLQPSALRLMVTAVVGLLAPLFWPGCAARPARTALLIVAWATAAACLAAIALRVLGNPAQPLPRIVEPCAMLMPILLLTHTAAAAVEGHLRRRSWDADNAREIAGRTVAITLALLGALPLWLGPLGELLSGRHAWIIDAVVGMSPLTHLAVASDNDLLRNQWFYQHSNLAALQFSYPGPAQLAWSYALVGGVLALLALALRRSRLPITKPPRPQLTSEKSK